MSKSKKPVEQEKASESTVMTAPTRRYTVPGFGAVEANSVEEAVKKAKKEVSNA